MFISSAVVLAGSDSKSGTLDGQPVSGGCTANQTSASAYTSLGGSGGSASVSATYMYHNIYTNATGSYGNSSGGINGGGVSFSAPVNCHTTSISASHSAYYNGQYWSASTFASW